jgi:hypothetical protein
MHSKFSSIIAFPVVLLAACANYATFQEADTVAGGQGKTGFGATYTNYQVQDADGTKESVNVPALNIWRRQGLTDNLEVHASAWIPLGASAGVKYQLLGNRHKAGLALSLGVDFGFLQIGAKDANGDTANATIVDTYVPVYLGYRLSDAFALYASPKFIFRYETTGGGTDSLAGGTLGLALGAQTTLHLEGGVIYDSGLSAPAYQAGVGVAF